MGRARPHYRLHCATTKHHCDMQGNGRAEVHTPSMSVPRVKASASKASKLIQASIKKVSLPAEAVTKACG